MLKKQSILQENQTPDFCLMADKNQNEKHTTIKRWQILKNVIDGKLSLRDASRELEVSYRQAIRMKKAVVEKGVRGLIHGNTGRKPGNSMSDKDIEKITELSQKKYAVLNDTRLSEVLQKEHDIKVSRETIRKIRRSNNIQPLKIRNKQRIPFSENRAREGVCLFWDCIITKWFPESDYACCLFAAIDDASGRCVRTRFFPFEESAVYLWGLQNVVATYGIPKQIIQDKNPLLKRNDSDWSIEEQLRGEAEPTQIGKAMEALGICSVFVNTSRQKKYFNRIFEQLNICLAEELFQHNIKDINEGNHFLEQCFVEDFNKNYALSSNLAENCWKRSIPNCDLERICSFRYDGELSNSKAVKVGDMYISLDKKYADQFLSSKDLEVRQLLDGSWQVYFKDKVIGSHPSTSLLEPVRTKIRPKRNTTRAVQCKWTYPANKI